MNYDSLVSERAKSIPPSGIRKFFDIVSEMKDAISLGVGEPDFVTPWHIRSEAVYSLEKGRTHYTANSGLLELRRELSLYMERRIGVSYDPAKEVLVTVGGSEAIDLCIRALVNPGDEVLVPEPSFVCYKPCAVLAGAVPVPLVTKNEDKFKLTKEALLAAITPKTKLLVLPYPNNPTGGVMTRGDLEEIAGVLRERDIFVLSDEIYGELTYGMEHTSIASLPGMRERTVIVNGFSKSYAMTGWRLGWAAAPKEIMELMLKIHQYAIMCAPTASQYAAVEAVKNGDEDIARMREQYNYRRRVIVEGFNKMGLRCFEPEGAFYVFPSVQSVGLSSNDFSERLLHEQKLAVVPGTAFGESGEGFIRCSYAYSIANITEALERIDRFVNDKGVK